METAQTTSLLQSVITLRALIEQEQDAADIKEDMGELLLLSILNWFIEDEQHQSGPITAYTTGLGRREHLRQILHWTDEFLDQMAEQADVAELPPAAVGLCRLLFQVTWTAFQRIVAIESKHPHLANTFAQERIEYNASREAA